MCRYFVNREYNQKELNKLIKQVAAINRTDLLKDKTRESKVRQTIFVCTWHPSLKKLPSILKNNFHHITNDPKLSKIFPCKPTVAYRKNKTLSNYLVKTEITKQEHRIPPSVSPCGKCKKLCPLINTNKEITNVHAKITQKIQATGNCRSKNLIYAAQCSKHNLIYIGHTGEQLSDKFSKHRYDITKRPENSELAHHFHKDHNIENDLNVTILQCNVKKTAARLHFEDK